MDGTSLKMTGEDAVSNYEIKDQLKPGDQFKLLMENESDKGIYVSAFAINNPNSVAVLYPIPQEPFGNRFIEPLMTDIAPHGRVESTCLRYVPGDGVVKFIVSSAPAELGFLDTEMSYVRFYPNSPLSYFLARELASRNFHSDLGRSRRRTAGRLFHLSC